MNILEEIAGKTRERIDQEKGKVSVAELKERIRDREQNPAILPTPSFYQALKKEGMSYICEVKKASPSKGLIAPDFPYVAVNFGSVSELFHTAIAPLLSTLLTFVLSAASLFS